MTTPAPLTITQGADRTIVISGIVDAAGQPLTVTGWTVHAQVRPTPRSPVVLAEWVSGTPTGDQGAAVATGTEVRLAVPRTMSSAWAWTLGHLHVEITEPGAAGRRERIASTPVLVDPEGVR